MCHYKTTSVSKVSNVTVDDKDNIERGKTCIVAAPPPPEPRQPRRSSEIQDKLMHKPSKVLKNVSREDNQAFCFLSPYNGAAFPHGRPLKASGANNRLLCNTSVSKGGD
jgi:hypothetical protein